MVQTPVRFKKGIAIELRKKGLSYSEIKNSINIPRSTIAYWLKEVELTEPQVEKLKMRRSEVARANSAKRSLRISREVEELKNASAKEVGAISKRELWLMGIMLYWRERLLSGNGQDLRKGVSFMSSDPDLIRFFLKWLRGVGKIGDEEIAFDIFAGKDKRRKINEIIIHWSKITGFSSSLFDHVYYLKKKPMSKKRNPGIARRNYTKNNEWGILRVRVKASSALARQMAGWMEGIRQL